MKMIEQWYWLNSGAIKSVDVYVQWWIQCFTLPLSLTLPILTLTSTDLDINPGSNFQNIQYIPFLTRDNKRAYISLGFERNITLRYSPVYIHFITIPRSATRVNTWKRKCWSGGVVGIIGYLAVVGEQPSDPCKHGKVTLNRHIIYIYIYLYV